jgi:hypothetical protein
MTKRTLSRSTGGGSIVAVFAVLAFLTAGGIASAAETIRLGATFAPERLGKPTAVSTRFQIATSTRGIPSPLTAIDFRFPPNLGFATSGLGLATCEPRVLEERGPAGCPANSIMGSGSALARFQVGSNIFAESATLGLVAGPSQNGYVRLLISATGISPVATRVVMSSLLLPGHLRIAVPLVPSLPEGPPVAVVAARVTLGGKLTYYETRHGTRVAYQPRGIRLPRRCPKGGFRFAASFLFLDGTSAAGRTTVRCPRAGSA